MTQNYEGHLHWDCFNAQSKYSNYWYIHCHIIYREISEREETGIEIKKGLIDNRIDVHLTTSKFAENHFSREKKTAHKIEISLCLLSS